jgi:flagellar basal-body rod protein FlgF
MDTCETPPRGNNLPGAAAPGGCFCRRRIAAAALSACWHNRFAIGTASATALPPAWESRRMRTPAAAAEIRGVKMENALLVGLSRQMALSHQLDIVANNIANLDTTGFKADNAAFSEFLMPGARDKEFPGKDQRIAFVQDRASWTDFSQGTVQQTGNPLDVAIDGKGFLVVQTPRGQRYTRNGALEINATGQLVTSEGDQVLGTGGPITFQPTDHGVTISPNGIITVRDGTGTADAPRGQLQIVSFDSPQQLQKDSGSTFMAPDGVNPGQRPRNTRVVQGAIEKSNVNAVMEMTRMIEITRSYTDVAAILQQQGDMRRNSLQQLAQTPSSSN